MQERFNFYKAGPDAMKALVALDTAVGKLGIDPLLLDLVKLRASQINGCAYCVDIHAGDARKKGDTERRLYTISVWREVPFFTSRERAALAWTEAITRVADTHAPDSDYEMLAAEFNETERVNLTLAINLINCWNRMSIGFRKAVPQ